MKIYMYVSAALLLLTSPCYAQQKATLQQPAQRELPPPGATDSLRLRPSPDGKGELKLNPEAVKLIDLSSGVDISNMKQMRIVAEKPWMRFDNTLPKVTQPVERTPTINFQALGLPVRPPLKGAIGVSISVDLMAPFEKQFWDRKGKKRRARTLEVLSQYGDSTTVHVNHPIVK
ncbi:MAG: DUF4858 domain-containing protein [Mediterranea sp.]|jgi:hypothetical protein|nr:DUF4858 domain-containing protein [Mediterranea sp.]